MIKSSHLFLLVGLHSIVFFIHECELVGKSKYIVYSLFKREKSSRKKCQKVSNPLKQQLLNYQSTNQNQRLGKNGIYVNFEVLVFERQKKKKKKLDSPNS